MRRLFSTLILLSLLILPITSRAQNSNIAGITVTPVTDEFTVKPGGVTVRTVRVINPVSRVVTLYPQILNFHTDNENGQPVFFSEKERTTTYGLANWVTFSKPFLRIAPNEEEKFDLTITVPENAEPGGHYGGILFSTEEPKLSGEQTQVSVVGLVGTLLLATVPGKINQKLALEEFSAPTFLVSPPANFSLLFHNTGNVHQKPQGEIKIRNWSGASTANLAINEGGGNVLPESKRRFANEWAFNWKQMGKFTATAVATYGDPEQQASAVRVFYIIPLWLLILITVLILLVIWLIMRRRKRPTRPVYVNRIPPSPPPSQPKPPRIVMR